MHPDELRQFCSVDEFARLTSLSTITVRRRLRDGSIPSVQPGGRGCRILIPVTALEQNRETGQLLTNSGEASPPSPTESQVPAKLSGPRPKWQKMEFTSQEHLCQSPEKAT
jgi:excisionase family DNA binding protein